MKIDSPVLMGLPVSWYSGAKMTIVSCRDREAGEGLPDISSFTLF